MTSRLTFRDGHVAVGCPIALGALAEIRRAVPRGKRAFDPTASELLIDAEFGLGVIDILAALDAEGRP